MISNRINRIDSLLDPGQVSRLEEFFFEQLNSLAVDFDIDESVVFALTQKETLLMRILSYRAATTPIFSEILETIKEWARDRFSFSDWFVNPMFYYKICRPGQSLIDSDAFLYTEPHYDKSVDGGQFLSFWVPLRATSLETGGLCDFDLPVDVQLTEFPFQGKNRLDLTTYLKDPNPIDQICRNATRNYFCEPGDVLVFGPECLHGATRPISDIRLSLNFQIFPAVDVSSMSTFERKKVTLYQRFPLLFLAATLESLGDKNGVQRILENRSESKVIGAQLEAVLSNISKADVSTSALGKKVHWRSELAWLNEIDRLQEGCVLWT